MGGGGARTRSYQAGHGLAPTLYHDAACAVEARLAQAGNWEAALKM